MVGSLDTWCGRLILIGSCWRPHPRQVPSSALADLCSGSWPCSSLRSAGEPLTAVPFFCCSLRISFGWFEPHLVRCVSTLAFCEMVLKQANIRNLVCLCGEREFFKEESKSENPKVVNGPLCVSLLFFWKAQRNSPIR